ncbi:MAG: Fe-S-containing hydro-lyase [Clostridiales bacterium]|jgi:fumarate hydratase subunit beta|nr:Fe-S-containing hydro-lyase [Clostridiales bacterium]
MALKKIQTPLTDESVLDLKAGDRVELSGTIFTARDAAHQRLIETIRKGEDLPFELNGSIIYYSGSSPAAPGKVIGACGPTTSYRMDEMTLPLLELGLKGMIGKGERSQEVINAMQTHKAVYFAAIGGAGALIARAVKKNDVIAYDDLGAEAIRKLEVEGFKAIVVIDAHGNNLYETEPSKYKTTT